MWLSVVLSSITWQGEKDPGGGGDGRDWPFSKDDLQNKIIISSFVAFLVLRKLNPFNTRTSKVKTSFFLDQQAKNILVYRPGS